MNLNVFRWAWQPRYYLIKPWKWIKELFSNIRAAWMRAIKGYCYMDVWNWDDWFCSVVPPMLRAMADKGMAYPGSDPFDTPEKWHDWLYEMAHLIETADETWQDEHNEYYEEYMKHIMDDWKPMIPDENGIYHHTPKEPSEIHKKFMERSKELAKEGEDNVRRALTLIGEHFYSIWD